MEAVLKIDNYVISTPLEDILTKLKYTLTNGKLKDIDCSKSDDIAVTCPAHAGGMEKSPDMHINAGKNKSLPYGFVHCFACGFSGRFEKFVAECFGSSEVFAKQWLIANFDSRIAFEKLDLGADIAIGRKTKESYMDPAVLTDYQDWCPYFAQRKLTKETCKKFNLKYDPVYKQVIFPCYDTAGHLLMAPKRSIETKIFYLDSDKEKPVYCLDYIIKNNINKCIITEGPFDCLTANQYGIPAIATLGAISDTQIQKINKSCIQVLYLMFDNDAAGRSFAEKMRKKLDKRILTVEVKIPSPYKDINDLSYETFWEIIEKHTKSFKK